MPLTTEYNPWVLNVTNHSFKHIYPGQVCIKGGTMQWGEINAEFYVLLFLVISMVAFQYFVFDRLYG